VATEAAMTLPYEAQRPIVSDNSLAVVVYVLYCVGYFTGISALIGVIIAHVKVDDVDPVLRSHYRFQIRTFWIGLLYLAIGIPLCVALIGSDSCLVVHLVANPHRQGHPIGHRAQTDR
jgi:uncharacterized membrane protein